MESVYTIGHSTRGIDDFLALLAENGIDKLIDVRRYPGSKRYPHVGREQLPSFLQAAGIAYEHVDALGGRRAPIPNSRNDRWRNEQFRGYADHMDSTEFRQALEKIISDAANQRQAIMCAEAVPWRCHRQLISDALVALGHEVLHIMGPGKADAHRLNPDARILPDGHLVYSNRSDQFDLL